MVQFDLINEDHESADAICDFIAAQFEGRRGLVPMTVNGHRVMAFGNGRPAFRWHTKVYLTVQSRKPGVPKIHKIAPGEQACVKLEWDRVDLGS